MIAEGPAGLQALSSFRAEVERRRDRTTLDIRPVGGSAAPVARMTKVGPPAKRAAYELFTGPGLDVAAGLLTASGGVDAHEAPFGIVNLSAGELADAQIHPLSGGLRAYASENPTAWRVVQPGLPALTGEAANRDTQRAFRRGPVSDAIAKIGITPLWLPVRRRPLLEFRFSAPGCEGFRVAMKGERFDVEVLDPRVDRRLVLACLAALTLKLM